MEELVSLVVKKTGLPKATAQSVVKIVLDYLKKKLPAPVGGAIDNFLSGKGQMAGAADLHRWIFKCCTKIKQKEKIKLSFF